MMESDDGESKAESLHFQKIVNSFRNYLQYFNVKFEKTIQFYDQMTGEQRQILHSYRQHIDAMKRCLEHNSTIMRKIAEESDCMFINGNGAGGDGVRDVSVSVTKPSPMDMEKTACVLRQIVREWTEKGETERKQSYGKILEAIDRHLPVRGCDDVAKKVLVPGAGLGRLVFEVARRGYAAQGNEYSTFMLIASHFILNRCTNADLFTIYPHVHQQNNVVHSTHQIQPVSFPDVCPASLPPDSDFSMAAGNFVEVYSGPDQANTFDCVVTCFFIDTGHNILQYIETIRNVLRPGGIWINLGPLLYHFADSTSEDSVEPSYNFVKEAILSYKFQFVEEELDVPCLYTQNPDSMLSYIYKCVFFVVKKPASKPSGAAKTREKRAKSKQGAGWHTVSRC